MGDSLKIIKAGGINRIEVSEMPMIIQHNKSWIMSLPDLLGVITSSFLGYLIYPLGFADLLGLEFNLSLPC
jgi:hypothetical protein